MSSRQHVALAVIWLAILSGSLVASFERTEQRGSTLSPGGAPLTETDDAFFADDADFTFMDDTAGQDAIAPQLLGIDEHGEQPRARIREGRQLAVFDAGDVLPQSQARVTAILDNAVLINSDGAYHLLCCVQPSGQKREAVVPGTTLVDLRRNREVTQVARAYHSRLYINPLSLMGRVKVVQATISGRLAYKVYPGTDKRAFALFGLRPGDELIGVNGVALASGKAVPVLYEQLAAASHIALTVQRGGEMLVVLLSLNTSV